MFGEKLRDSVVDDKERTASTSATSSRPASSPTSLDDYVRAVSDRELEGRRAAQDALRYFARLRGRKPRIRMILIRSPRLFRLMFRA